MTTNGSNTDHFIKKEEELSKIEINTNDVVKWLPMHGCDYVKLVQAGKKYLKCEFLDLCGRVQNCIYRYGCPDKPEDMSPTAY